MSEQPITGVTYRSGTHPTQGWDVMQVIFQSEDPAFATKRVSHSFVIARDANETILRKTDLLLDRWETTTDEDDLRFFRSLFNNRDKLRMEEAVKTATP